MRAFRNELFSYSVAREGISPQNAKATLEQALIDLKEPMSNQKSLQAVPNVIPAAPADASLKNFLLFMIYNLLN